MEHKPPPLLPGIQQHIADKKTNSVEHTAHAAIKETWLDNHDVMKRMHISGRTLQKWRSEKLLPYSRIGKKIYYKESDLLKLLEQNMVR